MTDYHDVWGRSAKSWCKIDPRDSSILVILTVAAWIGMIGFFVFGALSALTSSDVIVALMLVSIAIWLGSGISAIRIRRGRRKFLKIKP
jgi:hypothetical protein